MELSKSGIRTVNSSILHIRKGSCTNVRRLPKVTQVDGEAKTLTQEFPHNTAMHSSPGGPRALEELWCYLFLF